MGAGHGRNRWRCRWRFLLLTSHELLELWGSLLILLLLFFLDQLFSRFQIFQSNPLGWSTSLSNSLSMSFSLSFWFFITNGGYEWPKIKIMETILIFVVRSVTVLVIFLQQIKTRTIGIKICVILLQQLIIAILYSSNRLIIFTANVLVVVASANYYLKKKIHDSFNFYLKNCLNILLMADCWALVITPLVLVWPLLFTVLISGSTVVDVIVITGPVCIVFDTSSMPVVAITWMLKLTSTLLFSDDNEFGELW